MPSFAFINKLEQAANNMMPRDSNNGTLNIEEHSYDDDFDAHGQFSDGNFKNQVVQMKDINKLFAGESHSNSDQAISDHKSEPQFQDTFQEPKISDMLQ